MTVSRLQTLTAATQIYGQRAFDNYAQIRSIAETLRDGFCAWMDRDEQCVFLVPPKGEFASQNYGSGAFSISGASFLPLDPISFGLAVKISNDDDFMRLTILARKEGERMFLSLENGDVETIDLPAEETQMLSVYETLYDHILRWFTDRVERYDNGDYGTADIGFDIQRMSGKEIKDAPPKII